MSGAHRTGKTTVARLFAEANDCPFIASSATQVAKDMGIKVDGGMDFGLRLAFQEEVLTRFVSDYEKGSQNGMFISDRTPLDMAAYLIADWHPNEATVEQGVRAADYIDRCMDITGQYFFLVSVIQPGIPYITGDGKPAPNVFYQELLNTTIQGLASDRKVKSHYFSMPRDLLDPKQRCNAITHVYGEKWDAYSKFLHEVLAVQ